MKSVILGAGGQDGQLLAAALARKGHVAAGYDRTASGEAIQALDITQPDGLLAMLQAQKPDIIFHLAAVHGHAGSRYETLWRQMQAVNVGSVRDILEYMRARPATRLIYASSIKAYSEQPPLQLDDATPMQPGCLYGITKQTATALIGYYRRVHGLRASALHLSNHESWLRPPQFFIPKLVHAVASAIGDPSAMTELHTLNFHCDWGSALEYMTMAATLAESDLLDRDYLVATGQSTSAADLAEGLFAKFGLDYRNHIKQAAPSSERPAKPVIRCDNLWNAVGRPAAGIEAVCLDILSRNYKISPPR